VSTLKDLEVSRLYPARSIHVVRGDRRLVLRPTLTTDAETICAAVLASLPELKPFMPWAHAEHTARTQLDRLRGVEAEYFSGDDMVMGLFREDGAFLTMVGLHPRTALNPKALEVGYWTPTEHTRRGYATLAAKLAAIYAFDKLGSDRLQVMCDEANTASRRVIEKVGFAFEGTMRNMTSQVTPELIAGGFRGTQRSLMFSLVPETFERLPWVEEVRASMTYVNLGGYEVR
jgi:RimJ/RimL family protein N-acetyltransferase